MKKLLLMLAVVSATTVPTIANAQWQVTYAAAKSRWTFFPQKTAPPPPYDWYMTNQLVSVNNGIASDETRRGSSGIWDASDITLYYGAQSLAIVDITVRWVGSPASVPANVHLRLTTTGWAEYHDALAHGTLTLNDGFGGHGSYTTWGSTGHYHGAGSATHVENYYITTNGQTTVLNTQIQMNNQADARLQQVYPADPYGTLDTVVEAGWFMSMAVNP